MSKDDVVAKVKALMLPDEEYVVFGSGPMALYGIRDVNDIDMLVSSRLRASLAAQGWDEQTKGEDDTPLAYDVFEVHDNWNFSEYSPTLEDLVSRSIVVDGVRFASLEDVLKWKQAGKRQKDADDVKLILDFFEKHGTDTPAAGHQ